MASVGQSFGKNLPDQVDRISALSNAQLELCSDIRELYRDRAALEREFAGKLQVLAKKAADKKAKKISTLVFGNNPTKVSNEDATKQSTLENAYSEIIASVVNTAQDHIDLADALGTQVADTLKATERRHEEANKKQMQYYQKLLAERERLYADRIKRKQKYDDECAEVESYRQKQERSSEDRHADRIAKQFEQQQTDMFNAKNTYIIATAVANKSKSKFYTDDLPALEDQFQDLQTQLINKLVEITTQAQTVHANHLDSLKSRIASVRTALDKVEPAKDQDLFVEYNVSAFSEPPDWSFEPCAVHYDTGDMSVEPEPKVYLQNRLRRCRVKVEEVRPTIDAKNREVEHLQKLVTAYFGDRKLGNPEQVSDDFFEMQHQLVFVVNSECVLITEIETIAGALGGDEGQQNPHTFKSSAFSIPTQCAHCKSSIWGLSKQGKTCKACGISVHAKCELKIPANCSGLRGVRGHAVSDSISPVSRMSSTVSRSTSVASKTSSLTTSIPSSFTHNEEEPLLMAHVLFGFTPTSPFELAVSEGSTVRVLEEDDGSGWVKVSDDSGGKGLVPASYLELSSSDASDNLGSRNAAEAPNPQRPGGSGKYARGLYEYQPQGPDEIAVEEGALIELTDGVSGGQNYADGWWEGLDARGKRGIFPSNYVELA